MFIVMDKGSGDRGTGYCPAGKDKNITSKAIGTLTSPLSRNISENDSDEQRFWLEALLMN